MGDKIPVVGEPYEISEYYVPFIIASRVDNHYVYWPSPKYPGEEDHIGIHSFFVRCTKIDNPLFHMNDLIEKAFSMNEVLVGGVYFIKGSSRGTPLTVVDIKNNCVYWQTDVFSTVARTKLERFIERTYPAYLNDIQQLIKVAEQE